MQTPVEQGDSLSHFPAPSVGGRCFDRPMTSSRDDAQKGLPDAPAELGSGSRPRATARQSRPGRERPAAGLPCRWAITHPAESIDEAETIRLRSFGDTPIPLAGPGAPLVAELSIAEYAAAIGLPTEAGKRYLGHALEKRYRLPRLWKRVVAGDLAAWKARRIADQTPAPLDGGRQVRRPAPRPGRPQGPSQPGRPAGRGSHRPAHARRSQRTPTQSVGPDPPHHRPPRRRHRRHQHHHRRDRLPRRPRPRPSPHRGSPTDGRPRQHQDPRPAPRPRPRQHRPPRPHPRLPQPHDPSDTTSAVTRRPITTPAEETEARSAKPDTKSAKRTHRAAPAPLRVGGPWHLSPCGGQPTADAAEVGRVENTRNLLVTAQTIRDWCGRPDWLTPSWSNPSSTWPTTSRSRPTKSPTGSPNPSPCETSPASSRGARDPPADSDPTNTPATTTTPSPTTRADPPARARSPPGADDTTG